MSVAIDDGDPDRYRRTPALGTICRKPRLEPSWHGRMATSWHEQHVPDRPVGPHARRSVNMRFHVHFPFHRDVRQW